MRRRSTLLLFVCAACVFLGFGGTPIARAQGVTPVELKAPLPQPSAPPPLAECHAWQVAYDDTELGRVYGTATVDWKYHDVQVRLVSPATGAETVLTAMKFTPPDADGLMEFVLRGDAPNLHPVATPSTAGLSNVGAANGAELTVKRSESQVKAKLAQRDFADDTVTLTMSAEDDNDLIGRWHYRADPLTERARDGGGRAGAFAMPGGDDAGAFLGVQSGREEWTVLRPKIFYAVVLEDQAEQDRFSASYPYPRPHPKTERGAGTWSDHDRYRRIMIVGSNLPIWREPDGRVRQLEPIETERKDLNYGKVTPLPTPKPGEEPDEDVESGWRQITAGMDEAAARTVRKLQAVEVRVDFAPGVLPGVTDFTWGGAKAAWLLQFGDCTAQVRVVRAVPGSGQWEATPVVFLPEEVTVEVETAQALPLDSIKVYVAANGAFLPEPFEATRVGGPGSQLYRATNQPLSIFNPARDTRMKVGRTVSAQLGDRIAFVAEQQRGLFCGAAQTEVAVYNDPSELSTTWHHALSICARIAGKPEIDWAHTPGQQVEALTRYFVFSWIKDGATVNTGIPVGGGAGLELGVPTKFAAKGPKATCNLTLGQHAAMLMERDLFIELMKRQQASLRQTSISADAVLGFGKTVAQSLHQNLKSLFSTFAAGSLNGKACTLADAVDDAALKRAFGAKDDEIRKWKLSALRTGLNAYQDAIQKSIDQAVAVKNDQREDLLKLTGRGFGAVEAQLKPRLMRYDEEAGRWVPDMVARGYVDSIGSKEQELEDLGAAAKIDTQLAVGILSAVATAPVMISEAAFASFLTWAANGLIWELQSVAEIYETHQAKREVEFAVGASAVLGHLRYDEAKLRDTEWWKVAASITLQGIGANLQAIDALSKFSREMSVFRGLQTLESVEGGVQGLRQLAQAQRAEVQAAAMEAKALALAGKDINPSQARALFLWEEFSQQLAEGEAAINTAWLKSVRLKRAITLLEEDGGVLNEARAAAIGVDAEAAAAAKAALARRESLHEALAAVNRESGLLKAGKPADEAARKLASDQLKALASRDTIISDVLAAAHDKPSLFGSISDAEVAWISGVQKEVDVARMEALAAKNGNAWADIKYGYEHGKISAPDMHQFVTWRKQKVDKLVDEVIADVEKEMQGLLGRPVKIQRKAFGSTNLTSDYDISVEGVGAERVVGKFNERFRAANKGLESAFVFDTNVYTDPVYKLFKSRALTKGSLELGTVEMDTIRQFAYDQMAMRKYAPDAIWAQQKALMYEAAGPECRGMLDFAFNEAETGCKTAVAMIEKRLAGGKGANAVFLAQNEAYSDVLRNIDQWRLEMERLDGLFVETSHYKALPSEEFLDKFPVYRERLKKLDGLLKDKDLAGAAKLRDEIEDEVIAQMRDGQGTALYFASEAYQSEGTIIHVVDELQGPLKRKVTLASLKGAPVKTELDTLSYLNSFNENRANMFKEFSHLGVFDGTVIAGEKLAAKGAKYFIRQLEAMKQAGFNLTELVGEDLLAVTVGIDDIRGNAADVAAALKRAGMNGKQFADKIRAASDRLAIAGVKERQFNDLAKFLSPQCEDLNRLRGVAKVK